MAHFLGLTGAGDAYSAAFRIPNVLQNLFGEGALSASFIPAYTRLISEGDDKEARRLAGSVLGLLSLVVSTVVLAGILVTPWIVAIIAPGFEGARRDLAITLVRILFPGTGLLVLAAWCLGVLNSHRRFFLSYAAPVAWNGAIIVALIGFGREGADGAAIAAAWGAVVGSGLQVAVQWPTVRAVAGRIPLGLGIRSPGMRAVTRNFIPAVMSRGVLQISAYVDTLIATLLPVGAVIAITNAQTIYMVPVSLFGMAIAASELPVLSASTADEPADARGARMQARLGDGWDRLAYLIIPSSIVLLGMGEILSGAIFQTGVFTARDASFVGLILSAAGIGLLPATAARLWSAAFYALGDTRTPLRFAVVRVSLGIVGGLVAALWLPGRIGLPGTWGAVFLVGVGAVAGWIEFLLLRRALRRILGVIQWRPSRILGLCGLALLALVGARMSVALLAPEAPLTRGGVALSIFALMYGGLTLGGGNPTAREIWRTLRPGK